MKPIQRVIVLSILVFFLAGCGDDESFDTVQNPAVCHDPTGDNGDDLILSGRIERAKTDFSFNDDITFVEGAHASVTIRRYEGEDAVAPLTFSADMPFSGFPLEFTLKGDASTVFADGDEFLVGVEILNHDGCDTRVGDLINEVSHRVDGPETDYTITVEGLEACGSENSGGFCAGQ